MVEEPCSRNATRMYKTWVWRKWRNVVRVRPYWGLKLSHDGSRLQNHEGWPTSVSRLAKHKHIVEVCVAKVARACHSLHANGWVCWHKNLPSQLREIFRRRWFGSFCGWYRQGKTEVFGDKHVPVPHGLAPGSNPGLCGKRVPLNSARKIQFLQHNKHSQPLLRKQPTSFAEGNNRYRLWTL
jgi:hypothetical protein